MLNRSTAARTALFVAVALLALPGRLQAQTGANVLVVINTTSATSEAIGRRYAARRGVPQDNVCSIALTPTETVTREVYNAQIERPIWKCIASARAQDRILYIVLTKDVPLRIRGSGGRNGTNASVDSELTLLYRRSTLVQVPMAGFVVNPYFAGTLSPTAIKPFSHEHYDIYLVTRLDAYTEQEALALIEKGVAPSREGVIVLDQRSSFVDSGGNTWLAAAADRLKSQGFEDRLVFDETAKVVTNQSHVLGYYSWGSNDEAIRIRKFNLEFVPGALAGMFVSTDGRTFKEPPASWLPSGTATRDTIFGGSHQSLMADLIREGATGASGHVDEPFLDGTTRPDILFPAYVSGRNLAESFYAAMPYLSWQTIVIGDPLCAPFPHTPLTTDQIDPGLDSATETPARFALRRLASFSPTLKKEAATAFVRGESRSARNDLAGWRQALEAAIAAEPKFTLARMQLATAAAEQDNDYETAAAQYRAILQYAPNDAIALNNLAYDLSVRRNKPEEALPMVQRAITIMRLPQFFDTLAWSYHLLKRDREAAGSIQIARSSDMLDPDVLWHAAVIYAAVNDLQRASAELALLLKVKPEFGDREDVKKLRQTLPPLPK